MKSTRMHLGVAALGALLGAASASQIAYIEQLRAKAAALQGAPHPEVAAFGDMANAFILQLEAPPVHMPVPVSVVSVSTVTVTVAGPARVATTTVTVAGACEGAQTSAPAEIEIPRTVTGVVVPYAPPTAARSSVTAQEIPVVTRTVMRVVTTVTCEEEEAGGIATTPVVGIIPTTARGMPTPPAGWPPAAVTTMSTRTRGGVAAVTEPCDD